MPIHALGQAPASKFVGAVWPFGRLAGAHGWGNLASNAHEVGSRVQSSTMGADSSTWFGAVE